MGTITFDMETNKYSKDEIENILKSIYNTSPDENGRFVHTSTGAVFTITNGNVIVR